MGVTLPILNCNYCGQPVVLGGIEWAYHHALDGSVHDRCIPPGVRLISHNAPCLCDKAWHIYMPFVDAGAGI